MGIAGPTSILLGLGNFFRCSAPLWSGTLTWYISLPASVPDAGIFSMVTSVFTFYILSFVMSASLFGGVFAGLPIDDLVML